MSRRSEVRRRKAKSGVDSDTPLGFLLLNPSTICYTFDCYRSDMARRTTSDSRWQAEQAFKAATSPKPPELAPKTPALPGVKELVSLRIDRDVLDFFQEDGPGWQERINAALRKAAGK